MFSEEAFKARNKNLRKYREFNNPKFSRSQTLTDLINTLLYTSDLLISSKSRLNNTRLYGSKVISSEVRELLSEPTLTDVNLEKEGQEEIEVKSKKMMEDDE